MFHGSAGQAARDAFVTDFNKLPATEQEFDEKTQPGVFDTGVGQIWRRTIVAAVNARTEAGR